MHLSCVFFDCTSGEMRISGNIARGVLLTAAIFSLLPFPVSVSFETEKNSNKNKLSTTSLRSGGFRRLQMKRKNPDQKLSVTEIVNKLKQYYNKNEPPSQEHPTEVKLGIYVNSFYSINEQTMDYSVSMYLRQSWFDHRLAFERFSSRLEAVRMGEGSWNEIWVPDTFFRNEKAATFHEVTVSNRMLRLSRNGMLWYVTKISATLSCPMNLQKYPLDTQSCPMMFESFGYTMDTVFFSWLDIPVDIDQGLQLPQFTLEKTTLYDCSQNYTAGAFPCLDIQFVLRRDVGFFLIQVYVPSILIVILSWVSFWINVDASPARVSIGLLTVLTTTTMSAGARASLPRVSYIKAIDVWMIICLVFVFASLIEYAVVNVLSRKQARTGGRQQRTDVRRALRQHLQATTGQQQKRVDNPTANANLKGQLAHQTVPNGPGGAERRDPPVPPASSEVDGKFQARRIDKLSRKCFPLAFVLFNVIYWTYYAFPSFGIAEVV